jgi:hypothetical protein
MGLPASMQIAKFFKDKNMRRKSTDRIHASAPQRSVLPHAARVG